jgi:hypothetical protein
MTIAGTPKTRQKLSLTSAVAKENEDRTMKSQLSRYLGQETGLQYFGQEAECRPDPMIVLLPQLPSAITLRVRCWIKEITRPGNGPSSLPARIRRLIAYLAFPDGYLMCEQCSGSRSGYCADCVL